jgi:DNA mismatch repair protein MutH
MFGSIIMSTDYRGIQTTVESLYTSKSFIGLNLLELAKGEGIRNKKYSDFECILINLKCLPIFLFNSVTIIQFH